jgi:hypothetical protein
MADKLQPSFGGKSSENADNGGGAKNTSKDKSGFGGGKVDPGIRSPFRDAIFKK